VILEYMLLVALYESWLFPLVRMLTVPLGMIGAFLLLFLTGNTINIFSIIGLIMGEGLVAKSGILLVDYTNTLRERGVARTQALQEAVRVRLRPILMTSATMIFGMLPLALKLEPGAETRAPMAVVVIGALLSSTLLTLVLVPSLYSVMDDAQTRLFRRARRQQPIVSPARAPEAADAVANGAAQLPIPVDLLAQDQTYVLRAALPGLRPTDIKLQVHDHTVTIRADQPASAVSSQHDWLLREHASCGVRQRSITLPLDAETAAATAVYTSGVLELSLPRAAPAPAREIPIGGGAEVASVLTEQSR
jgi:HSP20 family molecular chaperone IbpA